MISRVVSITIEKSFLGSVLGMGIALLCFSLHSTRASMAGRCFGHPCRALATILWVASFARRRGALEVIGVEPDDFDGCKDY